MGHRIELIQNSSVDEKLIDRLKTMIKPNEKVMVVLDSNHSTDHVYREMQLYSPLVTPGSYLVTMDGAQAFVWDIPRGNKAHREDNPLDAILQFTKEHPEYEVDPYYTRMDCTSSPLGFLKKRSEES